jgi:hypothetical protein
MSKRVVVSAAACGSLYEPSPLSHEERLTLNAVIARAKLPPPGSTLDMILLHEHLTSRLLKKRRHPRTILGGALSIALSVTSILPSYRGALHHHIHCCRGYRTEDLVAALTSIITAPSAIIAEA